VYVTALAGILGIYTFPFLLAKDISHMEIKLRDMNTNTNTNKNKNKNKNEFLYEDVWSLWDL